MAKFPYIVVRNDIWYPAGAEVPVEEPVEEKVEEPVEEKKTTRARKK